MTSKDLIITDEQLHMVWIDNEPYVKFQHLQEHRQGLLKALQPPQPEEEPPQPPQPSIYLEDYIEYLRHRYYKIQELHRNENLHGGSEKLSNVEFALTNASNYLNRKDAT